MEKNTTPTKDQPQRQIVGLSLPPDVAADLKMEAARRGLSIRKLFLEMWALYQKNPK